jgi:hypothetical protein
MKAIGIISAAMGLLGLPAAPALACATCFAASSPRALYAYYLSTILLSTMPFLLAGAFLLYLRRHPLGPPAAPDALNIDPNR